VIAIIHKINWHSNKYNIHQKLRLLSEHRVYVGLHPRTADIQPAEYTVSHLAKKRQTLSHLTSIIITSFNQSKTNKMVFSTKDLVLIKVLRQEKGYDN